MSKNLKLDLTTEALVAILQIALNSAIEQKSAAMGHHDMVARGFHVPEGRVDAGTAMAVKEISESLEKLLKSADASLDKIIKIARLVADVMLKRQKEEFSEMTDEEKLKMQEEIHEMIHKAANEKEDS
jgi:ElaB/YqjD/DUF883 family membrane-anchored ribosome-binding protein